MQIATEPTHDAPDGRPALGDLDDDELGQLAATAREQIAAHDREAAAAEVDAQSAAERFKREPTRTTHGAREVAGQVARNARAVHAALVERHRDLFSEQTRRRQRARLAELRQQMDRDFVKPHAERFADVFEAFMSALQVETEALALTLDAQNALVIERSGLEEAFGEREGGRRNVSSRSIQNVVERVQEVLEARFGRMESLSVRGSRLWFAADGRLAVGAHVRVSGLNLPPRLR